MGELVGLEVPFEELSPINQQNKLLDRFWVKRVIREGSDGDAREVFLKKVTESMVNRRSLKTNRFDVVDISTSTIMNDLLSSQILTEWQDSPDIKPERSIIAFSHHIIYDYAVSRLLLRISPSDLTDVLTKEPDLLISLRPSIVMHFKYSWSTDPSRKSFWSLAAEVFRCENMNSIGKLIGPYVASELAVKINDFEPLLDMLQNQDASIQHIAEEACKHVVGALLSLPESSYSSLIGIGAGPWAELVLRFSDSISWPLAYTIRQLLTVLCEHHIIFTSEQEHCIGLAARRLLTFASENLPRNQWLINCSIQAICRSYKSDSEKSGELIRQSLQLEHMKLYAVDEMQVLAREVKNLIDVDAKLVEDIYKAAFTYSEDSNDMTQLGSSQILAMTSTRKQDYHLVKYSLAQDFPEFVRIAPINAICALIIAIETNVNLNPYRISKVTETSFEFNGFNVKITEHGSNYWNAERVTYDDEIPNMLTTLENYILEVAEGKDLSYLTEIIKVIAIENKMAVLWNSLISCGIKAPETLGQEIKSLAWSKPILMCSDTTVAVGNFIGAIYEYLSARERALIENTIMSLTDETASQDYYNIDVITRNRLLGCVPVNLVVAEQVRQTIEDLRDSGKLPPNDPHFHIHMSDKSYDEDESWARRGVAVEEEIYKLIKVAINPIQNFNKAHINSNPSLDVIQRVYPDLHNLCDELLRADENGVHVLQKNAAYQTLTEACRHIASSQELPKNIEIQVFVKDILLEAAKNSEPVHQPEKDSNFDESISWCSAPRIDAAIGLMRLACMPSCLDDTLLQTIKVLAQDEVPAIRYHIVSNLWLLYHTALDVMWEIIENECETELSTNVLYGLVHSTFRIIMKENINRISSLTNNVYNRITKISNAKAIREACAITFDFLFLWYDDESSRGAINQITDNPKNHFDEIRIIITNNRDIITHGPVTPSNEEQDNIRKRALNLCERILNSVITEFKYFEDSIPKNGIQLSPEEIEEYKGLAKTIDNISSNLYFASGAYDKKRNQQSPEKKPLTLDEKKRFWNEASNIFDSLSSFGSLPSVTHHLIETLESYIPIDPIGVFEKVGRIITIAKVGGYQYESLAADLIIKIIEQYLAEYGWIFREQLGCQSILIEILDIFVDAGWPNARRLTYRLEEIYR